MAWVAIFTSKQPLKHIEVELTGCVSRKEAKARAADLYEKRIKPEHGHMLTQVQYDKDILALEPTTSYDDSEWETYKRDWSKETKKADKKTDPGLSMKPYTLNMPRIEKL